MYENSEKTKSMSMEKLELFQNNYQIPNPTKCYYYSDVAYRVQEEPRIQCYYNA